MNVKALRDAAIEKGLSEKAVDAVIAAFGGDRALDILADQIEQRRALAEFKSLRRPSVWDPFTRQILAAKDLQPEPDPWARFGRKQLNDMELTQAIEAIGKVDGIPQALIDALSRKLGKNECYDLLVQAHGSTPKWEMKF